MLTVPPCSALEGVVAASIFEELSAATPSWAGPRLPGAGEDVAAAASLALNLANLDTLDPDQVLATDT